MNTKSTNLIIGKLESGKTRGIMFKEVEKLIEDEKSLFIVDNKEEYYPRFKSILEQNGYDVYLINLRNPQQSNGFDLLAYPYYLYQNNKDIAVQLVISLAKSICFDENKMDSFWENSAADYLAGMILTLFEKGNLEEINLKNIALLVNYIDDEDGIKVMKEYFKSIDVSDIIYKLVSSTLFAPTETRGGIMSTLKMKINLFLSRDSILNVLSLDELKIKQMNKKTAIFFEGKGYTNIMVNTIIEQLLNYNKEKKIECAYIIEDINILPNILEVNELIEYASFNKLKSYFITNNLEELKQKYGEFLIDKITNVIDMEEIVNLEIDSSLLSVTYPEVKDANIKLIDPASIYRNN